MRKFAKVGLKKGQKKVGRTKKIFFFTFSLLYIHKNLPKKTISNIIFEKKLMMTHPSVHDSTVLVLTTELEVPGREGERGPPVRGM